MLSKFITGVWRFGLFMVAMPCFSQAAIAGNVNAADKSVHIDESVASDEVALTAEEKKRALRLYVQCRACHTLKKGEPNRVGPNLYGMFGSKAAYVEGFAYSKPLIESDVVWNDETMDLWLEKPTALVPGTKMVYGGMRNKADRELLIRYLKIETQ